jgi:condensin complex subunit 3
LPTSSPNLRANIVEVFADAQRATTGHRKLVVRLRKIQEYCCGLRTPAQKGKKGRTSLGGLGFDDPEGVAEKEFDAEISRCVLRVLVLKKAEGAGDRVVKFLGTFLKAATDKGTSDPNLLGILSLTDGELQTLRSMLKETPIASKPSRKHQPRD